MPKSKKYSFTKNLIVIFSLLLIILPFIFHIKATAQNAQNASVSISYKETINLTLPEVVPAGNIIDIEVYNTNNQKIKQFFTTNGGNNYSITVSNLPAGNYHVSAGLFTPNWANNYAWYDNLVNFTVPNNISLQAKTITTQVTQTPIVEKSVAINQYNSWETTYVKPGLNGSLKVVRPENNNDTVSEGIGYGMLSAVYASDFDTFNGLWKYTQNFLDSKGLMNWQIDSNDHVTGVNAATDADEDIAYALFLGSQKWPGKGFDTAAKNYINSILTSEVSSSNLILPGDGWGPTPIMNPSYIAPSYYKAFAKFTGNNRWNDIAAANTNWIFKLADSQTGLLPDWKNADFSDANILFDSHKNDFYYDASRVPVRLLMSYRSSQDVNAKNILTKQSALFSNIGADKLTSGYTMSGNKFSDYLDLPFLTAYTAVAQVNPDSTFAKTMINKLVNKPNDGYFGASLKTLLLLYLAN